MIINAVKHGNPDAVLDFNNYPAPTAHRILRIKTVTTSTPTNLPAQIKSSLRPLRSEVAMSLVLPSR